MSQWYFKNKKKKNFSNKNSFLLLFERNKKTKNLNWIQHKNWFLQKFISPFFFHSQVSTSMNFSHFVKFFISLLQFFFYFSLQQIANVKLKHNDWIAKNSAKEIMVSWIIKQRKTNKIKKLWNKNNKFWRLFFFFAKSNSKWTCLLVTSIEKFPI